jgi:ATP-dependent Clp protease, protease subunit
MTVPWSSIPPEPALAPEGPFWPMRPTPPAPSPLGAPTRVWMDAGEWPGRLYERLFERRIVMAHGQLDGESATLLCAQLLTLDAQGDEPIRLELHGLDSDLPAALTVMGVLDVVGVPVRANAGGRISGPALGVLASCRHRRAYANAMFTLSEPRVQLDGSAAELTEHEEQLRSMLDALYFRLADVTGREVDEIRDDARRGRHLSAQKAISYGLVQGFAAAGGNGPA